MKTAMDEGKALLYLKNKMAITLSKLKKYKKIE